MCKNLNVLTHATSKVSKFSVYPLCHWSKSKALCSHQTSYLRAHVFKKATRLFANRCFDLSHYEAHYVYQPNNTSRFALHVLLKPPPDGRSVRDRAVFKWKPTPKLLVYTNKCGLDVSTCHQKHNSDAARRFSSAREIADELNPKTKAPFPSS